MKTCFMCGDSSNNGITLRTDKYVCNSCILKINQNIISMYNEIYKTQSKKAPFVFWDYLLILMCILIVPVSITSYYAETAIPIVIYIFILAATLGSIDTKSKKAKEPFYQKQIAKIGVYKNKLHECQDVLHKIYEQYWEIPPDWKWRRECIIDRENGRCKTCSRRMLGSRVPFHVHHIIPKSKQAGNHSLDNLMLLCEICHSKCEAKGHERVKTVRYNRLNRRHT